MPTQPKEPSCQAISIHVSIISANDGSTPPAGTGLNADIRPLAHISSTIAPVSVRIRSDSAASCCTTSRIPRASATTRLASTIDVIVVLLSGVSFGEAKQLNHAVIAAGRVAAVDGDGLTAYEGGVGRHEKRCHRRDLVGATQPLQGMLGGDRGHRCLHAGHAEDAVQHGR